MASETLPTPAPAPRALVTNDDGIESEGLRRLARAALKAGLDVVVAAPGKDLSGTSASLTAVRTGGRVVCHERRLAGLEGVPAYAVEATPAFITLLATRGAFGRPPDIVLSGINRGHNAGQAVLHSGTVGAAFTAAAYGRRALAVSLVAGEPFQWGTADRVVAHVLPALARAEQGIVLNVNVPNVVPPTLRGLCRAKLSVFGAVRTNVAESGQGFITVEMADVAAELEAGTDAALLAEGWATFTLLQPLCEVDNPWFDDLLSGGDDLPGI
ncbi:MAG: 5'/3'-nucleotidase SurE [Acidimicrobiales bacterium]